MAHKADLEEMRGKDSRELRYELETARKELFDTRLQLSSESTKASNVRNLRRKIAQLLTILRERETSGTADGAVATTSEGGKNEG